jgi:hypothetical protein
MEIKMIDNLKKYWWAYCTLLAIISALIIYINIPARVEKVEFKVRENEDSVQTLANNLDKYIAVQEIRQESLEKNQSLLVELIKDDKDGN